MMRIAMAAMMALCGLVTTRDGAASPAPALGWMSGHWCSDEAGRRIDEVWLPEAAGTLHGVSRSVADGRVESFEFMRVSREGEATTFHAQPNGAPPTAFVATAHGADWVQFENAAHDFPNRVEYRRKGDGLWAQISGPGEGGKPLRIAFDYRRCTVGPE